MTVKLVVSDVDGTIVQPDKSLSDGTIAAAGRLQAAGVPLAIVSARPPRGMRWIVETLGLEAPSAGFNGGAIVDPSGAIIEWNPTPSAMVKIALELFEKRGIDTWLFTQDEWLIRNPDGPHVEHERHTVRFNERLVEDFTPYIEQVGKLLWRDRRLPEACCYRGRVAGARGRRGVGVAITKVLSRPYAQARQ